MSRNSKGLYRLIQRYQEGTLDPLKKRVMDFWYEALGAEDENHLTEDRQVKAQMWNAIQQGMSAGRPVQEPAVAKGWWQSVYFRLSAACILMLIGFVFYKNLPGLVPVKDTIIAEVPDALISGLIRKRNDSSQNQAIKLSDGSTVTLDPGAVLYFPKVFAAGERKVFLQGNGFFNITPDKTKPFLVYADHIVTRVVGTSFSIRKKQEGNIEVAVLTGIVKVHRNDQGTPVSTGASEVTLTPNKKVTFYPGLERMITGIVDQPERIRNKDNDLDAQAFNFKDTPVAEILPLLEKTYGVRIQLAKADLGNCSITADVSQYQTLFEQLEILTAGIGADFEVKGDQVVLTGPGCSLTNKEEK